MAHEKRIYLFGFLGTSLAVLGVAAIIAIPGLISLLVHQRMALIPNNPSYPLWRDLDLPIYQKFYFFNVTNPREVEVDGATPNLVEVGPFVYRINISKSSLSFRDNQTKLTFRETKRYYFDRNLSVSDLDVQLTTLNVPLAVAYDTIDLASLNFFVRQAVKKLLASQSFFITATPDELLFKGKFNLISCIGHIIDPRKNPDCTFAYLAGQNNSNDGLWEVNTGVVNIRDVNSVISLNGSSRLAFWDGDQCNRIDGTSNGELFPPLDTVNGSRKALQFFRSDFCRVFNLTLDEEGIAGDVGSLAVDRFRPAPMLFANATENPNNWCYKPNSKPKAAPAKGVHVLDLYRHLKEKGFDLSFLGEEIRQLNDSKNLTEDGKLLKKGVTAFKERPSGVFDLSTCHDGLPIFVSYPHFLDADPVYLNAVHGLKPNLTVHETYIDLEPVTGTPVDFLARIQVNIDVNTAQLAAVGSPLKMKSIMMPTLWQEFSIHITKKMAHTISSQTRTPRVAAFSIATLIAVTGVCLMLYGAMLIFINLHRKRMSKQQQTPLLSDEQEVAVEDGRGGLDGEDSTNNNNIIG